jgi:hypothetical protein
VQKYDIYFLVRVHMVLGVHHVGVTAHLVHRENTKSRQYSMKMGGSQSTCKAPKLNTRSMVCSLGGHSFIQQLLLALACHFTSQWLHIRPVQYPFETH